MGSSQLGISLDEKEIDLITAFLKTLTGNQPVVEFPILPPNTYETPKPILNIKSTEITGHKLQLDTNY